MAGSFWIDFMGTGRPICRSVGQAVGQVVGLLVVTHGLAACPAGLRHTRTAL